MNKVYHPSTLPLHLLLLSACLNIHSRFCCNAFSSISPQRHRSPIQHHPMTTRTSTSFTHQSLLLDDGIHSRAGGGKCSNLCLSTTSLHSSTVSEAGIASTVDDDVTSTSSTTSWIIQWRGEGTEGYSEALRQLEFTSAFKAELADYLLLHDHDTIDDDDDNTLQLKSYYLDNIQFEFQDALTYHGPIYEETIHNTNTTEEYNNGVDAEEFEGEPIPLAQVATFESAMQYASITLLASSNSDDTKNANIMIDNDGSTISTLNELFSNTIQRCSLIRTAFQIVSKGTSHKELATKAIDNGSFNDKMTGGVNADATWSIRLRRYGPIDNNEVTTADTTADNNGSTTNNNNNSSNKKAKKRQARYGKNVRSPLRDERRAIMEMKELANLFSGKVDLTNPECRIYLLEGLKPCRLNRNGCDDAEDDGESKMLLARVIAQGPKTSIYRPNTRICITTTPLCPIASFALCNIAQIKRHQNPSILDPFAGSCATLLAAAHITSLPMKQQSSSTPPGGCRSIGVEIAHNGYVNRDDIVQDFVTRSLPPPTDVIRGDCLSLEIRNNARLAVGGAFDAIVTDPPYGIREAMSSSEEDDGSEEDDIPPLTKLFYAMGLDRANGTPLLKSGGRLVAFVPVRQGETLEECLPDSAAIEEAGLVMEGEGKEQVLSDILSRWLVSFVAI